MSKAFFNSIPLKQIEKKTSKHHKLPSTKHACLQDCLKVWVLLQSCNVRPWELSQQYKYMYEIYPRKQAINITVLDVFNLRILWLNKLDCNSTLHRAKSKSHWIIVFLWISENTHTAILQQWKSNDHWLVYEWVGTRILYKLLLDKSICKHHIKMQIFEMWRIILILWYLGPFILTRPCPFSTVLSCLSDVQKSWSIVEPL